MRYLLLIFLASSSFAASKYQYKDPKMDDEIQNIYHEIDSVLKGDVRISSVTITTLTVTGTINISSLGKVKQVTMCTVSAASSTVVASFVPSNMTCSVTPTATTSNVLIQVNGQAATNTNVNRCRFSIFRGTTNLMDATEGGTNLLNNVVTTTLEVPMSLTYLDSPSSTSSTSYTLYFKSDGTNACRYNSLSATGVMVLTEIGS